MTTVKSFPSIIITLRSSRNGDIFIENRSWNGDDGRRNKGFKVYSLKIRNLREAGFHIRYK